MVDYVLMALFLVILPMIICHQIARRRGSKPVFWAVMGVLFGPFAIPFVFFSGPKEPQDDREKPSSAPLSRGGEGRGEGER